MKHVNQQDLRELAKSFSEAKPFKHVEITELFDSQFLQKVTNELDRLNFTYKESDLFKFYQSQSLAEGDLPKAIGELRELLYSKEFVKLMSQITGLELTGKADLHATIYEDTNFLLVHDDKLDSRKIAFLIYLTDMEIDEGGALNLFENSDGKPTEVVREVIPKFNKFAMFEVSNISFHEVSEVIVDKQRIAIGGWYHAK